jgi:hypothetical protein
LSYPNQGEEKWAAFTIARVNKEPILIAEVQVVTPKNESMAARLLQGCGGYL